jgi:hypothetical protein
MTQASRDPLFYVLTKRLGLRKAVRVLLFIVQWGYVYEYMRGPLLSLNEFVEFWRTNERNAYREQKLFREAIGDGTPDKLWEELQAVNPRADELRAWINEIRAADLGTPRRRPPDVDEWAAMIGSLTVERIAGL